MVLPHAAAVSGDVVGARWPPAERAGNDRPARSPEAAWAKRSRFRLGCGIVGAALEIGALHAAKRACRMTKLIVDGKEIDVPPDYTLLQACEAAGAEISRFCFHEPLS